MGCRIGDQLQVGVHYGFAVEEIAQVCGNCLAATAASVRTRRRVHQTAGRLLRGVRLVGTVALIMVRTGAIVVAIITTAIIIIVIIIVAAAVVVVLVAIVAPAQCVRDPFHDTGLATGTTTASGGCRGRAHGRPDGR